MQLIIFEILLPFSLRPRSMSTLWVAPYVNDCYKISLVRLHVAYHNEAS